MSLTNYTFTQICQMLVVPAFFATLKMLLISGVLSTIFGFVFGVILILSIGRIYVYILQKPLDLE